MDYLDNLKMYDAGVTEDIEKAVNAMDRKDYEEALSHIMAAHCGMSYLSKEIDRIEALDQMESIERGAK